MPDTLPGPGARRLSSCALGVALWLVSGVGCAGDLGLEVGAGFNESRGVEAAILRYQREAAPFFGRESFWDFSLAGWNEPYRNEAIGAARGLRWRLGSGYFSASGGLAYVTEAGPDNHLGTHGQLVFRFALGRRLGHHDLSLAAVHYSNGKNLFGWNGPNTGENFLTLGLGRRF